jgi:hypothetical protein
MIAMPPIAINVAVAQSAALPLTEIAIAVANTGPATMVELDIVVSKAYAVRKFSGPTSTRHNGLVERFTGGEDSPINPDTKIIAAGLETVLRTITKATQLGTKKLSGFVCPHLSIKLPRKPAVNEEAIVSTPVAIPANVIEPVLS